MSCYDSYKHEQEGSDAYRHRDYHEREEQRRAADWNHDDCAEAWLHGWRNEERREEERRDEEAAQERRAYEHLQEARAAEEYEMEQYYAQQQEPQYPDPPQEPPTDI